MAGLIAAIDLKRKMYVEFEDAPYHMLEVEISRPTARGGQTLVRVKMRNLLNRAVFDKTFKAQDKLKEPDLVMVPASYQFADGTGLHFMDLETFETLTLNDDISLAKTYLTNQSLTATATYLNPSSINLSVLDEMLVVELTPVPEPAGLTMFAAAAYWLVRRRTLRPRRVRA
jgi:elongation factor P